MRCVLLVTPFCSEQFWCTQLVWPRSVMTSWLACLTFTYGIHFSGCAVPAFTHSRHDDKNSQYHSRWASLHATKALWMSLRYQRKQCLTSWFSCFKNTAMPFPLSMCCDCLEGSSLIKAHFLTHMFFLCCSRSSSCNIVFLIRLKTSSPCRRSRTS